MDLAEIQVAYYMVAATGVLVAAVFYIMNLREQRRNMRLTLETRRIGVVENLMATMSETNRASELIELLNYEWTDYADFEKKYGSDNNVAAAGKRYAIWAWLNDIGMMLRKEMATAEDLYDLGAQTVILHWPKWKPVVEEVRRRYWGQDYMRDFEYLFDEMIKVKMRRDPAYRVPETLGKFIPDK